MSVATAEAIGQQQPALAILDPFACDPADGRVRRAGVEDQEYGKSMLTYHAVGELAVSECLDTPEGEAAVRALKRDYDTALVEMINSDAELQSIVEVNHESVFNIVNDQVVNDQGLPIVESIEDGRDVAIKAAIEDPRMQTQVRRDQSFLINAQRVDEIASGKTEVNTRFVVSMEPAEEMVTSDGEAFWKGWGYRRGLAYIYSFHYTGNEMIAGAYSVDLSDKQTWLDLLSELGVEIPPEASTDVWAEYGFETTMTTEEALAQPDAIRQAYYQKRGQPQKRHSVDEILSAHRARSDQRFYALCLPLARAAHTEQKDEVIQAFVDGLAPHANRFKPKIARGLLDIRGRDSFDDNDVRLVESLVRYGVVESLRDDVKRAIQGHKMTVGYVLPDMTPQQIAEDTASHVMQGVKAGRGYGGCPGLTDPSAEAAQRAGDKRSPQEPYAGHSKNDPNSKKNWKLTWDVCNVTNCPSRGDDPVERAEKPKKTLCGPCGVCMGLCQPLSDLGVKDLYQFRQSTL